MKAVFVKVICKLANLFNVEEYNQCVYNYLGADTSNSSANSVSQETSSGGSGGGSSSA